MDISEKYDVCVSALREFAEGTGFSDCVIGLSGGIDSSVVAVMAVDALGASHVHGVLLPGPYSSDHSVTDALELAACLGIESRTVSIREPYEAFSNGLREALGSAGLSGLAAENTQARCRMVCLMALSNTYGWMLLNTGNKSEAFMGYSTLYGDTAGAFAPLGGLYKTDVYAVGRWRNEQAQSQGQIAPIPENVFVKPPSAELSANQEDERSMGISYDVLDRLLIASQEHGLDADELVRRGFDEGDVARVLATVRRTAFKRALEPPFPTASFYGGRAACDSEACDGESCSNKAYE
ncbi:NAD(+) synthase [Adlercreutzia sp. ZJ141]|uniref:NAD(+) synthase n=1 Tax=Adlercreutzia sp. ZJ141 TaxID=2709406 RepID=UPI0013EB7C2C|nr:NAD(+) synthase [Adlercreutzia sp. ZJ141]